MSLINIEVENNWNMEEKLPELERNVIKIASKIGLGEVTKLSPVDTGNMRDSWRSMEIGNVCKLFNSAEYTRYVNDGTRYMKGRHFVEKAIRNINKEKLNIVNQAFMKI